MLNALLLIYPCLPVTDILLSTGDGFLGTVPSLVVMRGKSHGGHFWIFRPWCNKRGYWDSISQRVDELIIEILWKYSINTLCSIYYSNDQIRSQFYTCHDSWTVVACAELWSDLMIIFQIKKQHEFLQDLVMISMCDNWTCSSLSRCAVINYITLTGYLPINPFYKWVQGQWKTDHSVIFYKQDILLPCVWLTQWNTIFCAKKYQVGTNMHIFFHSSLLLKKTRTPP